MATYTIHNTIESAANLWDVEVNGYKFTQSAAEGTDLVVSKKIDADHFRTALAIFNEGLFPLLDGLALHRLSATSAYGTCMLIEKEGADHALLKVLKRRLGTGLTLTGSGKFDPAIAEIEKLAAAKDPALFYFRHGILSENIISSTMHMLQAAESLAGKIEMVSKCRNPKCKASPLKCSQCNEIVKQSVVTDHSKLKSMLGKHIYKYFYAVPVGGNSMRNKIFHGDAIDSFELPEPYEDLEEAVKQSVIAKYNLKAIPGVKGTRQLHSYDGATIMIRFTQPLPPLPEIVDLFNDRKITSHSEPAFIYEGENALIKAF